MPIKGMYKSKVADKRNSRRKLRQKGYEEDNGIGQV